MGNITKLTASKLFSTKSVQQRFEQLLGSKAQGFITSTLQAVQSNKLLANADPQTVLNAAATAAALDLPINQSLGLAWIVPYKGQAQFQIGWRGYVQLALRSGEYSNMNVLEVYENQYKGWNPLKEELKADFDVEPGGEVVGYVAYMRMSNGFEKTDYWTKDKIIKHAKKYSQSYGSSHSPWQDPDQFDSMAKKTVLKSLISKWGLMSVEPIQRAVMADQSVVKEDGQYEYVDNETIDIPSEEAERSQEEIDRIWEFIKNAKTIDQLNQLEKDAGGIPSELSKEFEAKKQSINGSKN